MFTNFDCDCFWVANRQELIQTLSIVPEYLRNAASDPARRLPRKPDPMTAGHKPSGRRR